MLPEVVIGTGLNAKLLLPLTVSPVGVSGDHFSVRVIGLERPSGFTVEIVERLNLTFATLRLDSMARPLLNAARFGFHRSPENFLMQLESYRAIGVTVTIRLNGISISGDDLRPDALQWRSLELEASTLKFLGSRAEVAVKVASAVTALFVSILPLDDSSLDQADSLGKVDADYADEGRVTRAQSNRYERSRSNRAIAIAAHGTTCVVCGFNFSASYGAIGDGYIEIHHLLPVHLMDGPAVVNPLTDLVPLCSNCHRMVHREDPPIEPDELRQQMTGAPTEDPLPNLWGPE